MWNQLSNSLLEKNHIKIPIEKRFFLTFIEEDENNIQKNKIIEISEFSNEFTNSSIRVGSINGSSP